MYSTIAEQTSAALGIGEMGILEPSWVTGLNAMVDKATAAAGISLTNTLAGAVTGSALGMGKMAILEPSWVTGLNAMVDKATAAAGISLTNTLAGAVTGSALGMGKMAILEPSWVTGLNAMVDKATAAAGISLTNTLAGAVTGSALGMGKMAILEPSWVTGLNAMLVDSAQLRAADQLLTRLQWATNVDRPQIWWSASLADRTGELLSAFSDMPAEEVAGAAVAAGEVLGDPDRRVMLQRAARSVRPSGWTYRASRLLRQQR